MLLLARPLYQRYFKRWLKAGGRNGNKLDLHFFSALVLTGGLLINNSYDPLRGVSLVARPLAQRATWVCMFARPDHEGQHGGQWRCSTRRKLLRSESRLHGFVPNRRCSRTFWHSLSHCKSSPFTVSSVLAFETESCSVCGKTER